MCSFANVSLEENRELLFRVKTGGEDERGNQLYHKISRSRRAEEGKWMLEGGHGWQDGLGDLR